MLRKKGINFFIVIGLFVVYLVNGVIAIQKNSVTYDEMDHWSYGKRILKMQPQKVYPFDDASAMPISGLNAIPRAAEQLLNPSLSKTDGGFSDIMHGRYVTLFICLLTGFFIYQWSKKMFGEKGGLFSLFLFVVCPNLNAHGTLLTTDAYAALLTVSTTYYFWKFIKESGWKYFLAFSISLGIAQITKYSLVHLVLIFAVVSIFVLVKRKTLFTGWKINLLRLTVLALIVLFITNAGYLFQNTGRSLSNFELHSKSLSSLKETAIGKIPIPLPGPYIEGLDLTIYMNELGAGDPNVSGDNYLFGEKRAGHGFWYYYLAVFLFKTPLTVLFILLAAIIFLFVRKKKEGYPSTMIFLLGICFYFLFLLGFTNHVQIGIRHVILIYPLLYVLAGFFVILPIVQNRNKFITPILVIYSVVSFCVFFPNLISYTNELIPDKKTAYKIMADSNIDFGQGEFALAKYLKKHPGTKRAGAEPGLGKFVISINDYVDLNNTNKYNWLKEYKPVGHVNFCFLLFDTNTSLPNK